MLYSFHRAYSSAPDRMRPIQFEQTLATSSGRPLYSSKLFVHRKGCPSRIVANRHQIIPDVSSNPAVHSARWFSKGAWSPLAIGNIMVGKLFALMDTPGIGSC